MSAVTTEPLSRNNDPVEASLRPRAHRIASHQEALVIARVLAEKFCCWSGRTRPKPDSAQGGVG